MAPSSVVRSNLIPRNVLVCKSYFCGIILNLLGTYQSSFELHNICVFQVIEYLSQRIGQ